MIINSYSEEEIIFIISQKESTDLAWVEITNKYNKKFDKNKNYQSIKKCYGRYKNYFNKDDNYLEVLRKSHNTRRRNTSTARENRVILDQWQKRNDLIETIQDTVKSISLSKYKIPKYYKKSKCKKNMTLELLFSDVHYGKKIDGIEGNQVNHEIIRQRVKRIAKSVVKEIHRESKNFNVERLIISMIGDVIENADFHGKESTKSCEFSTARQVQEAINSIFLDLLAPIAQTGIKIDILCVTGNHDRISKDKTYLKPGEDNLTYIIYKTLDLLCKQSGLKNIKFNISSGLFAHTEVYGNLLFIEHGDELGGINRNTMLMQLNKRQGQINKVINFYRIGHWHEPVQYGQGKIMVNGSVPGQDGYAESKGFWSEAIQMLNYYVETEKRSTCFFRSFPIYLQEQKQ